MQIVSNFSELFPNISWIQIIQIKESVLQY